MPRPGRIFVEGGVYHVYNRIGRGEHVFAESDDASAEVIGKSPDGMSHALGRGIRHRVEDERFRADL